MNNINKTRTLTVFGLAMLITGAIDSIRNLPTTALFGSTLIFFFIISAIVFLIPLTLISAELSAAWRDKGGVYDWVKMAMGDHVGFFAIWLQWINTMVWYPTILSFIAATFSYFIDPALANNKTYLISIILGVFWLQTLINLRGVETSTWFASVCTVVGMIIPMVAIFILGIIWLVSGKPLQIHFTWNDLLPSFHQSTSWISLTAIITAFLGIELASVHVQNVKEPQKTFPKALLISLVIILSTMIFGSLAIAFVLPQSQISLVGGVMQAFSSYLDAYHIGWMLPVLTAMVLIGSIGGMVNWIISPARGLRHAAENHYLPKFFCNVNKHGVAHNILIAQAILVSLLCLAFMLMPSVNGSYWLLTDLSTELYVIMYVFLFLAAIILKYKYANQPRPFKVPFGNFGMWVACILGIIGCLVTLRVGFIAPTDINVGTAMHFETIFAIGMVLLILPAFGFMIFKSIVDR